MEMPPGLNLPPLPLLTATSPQPHKRKRDSSNETTFFSTSSPTSHKRARRTGKTSEPSEIPLKSETHTSFNHSEENLPGEDQSFITSNLTSVSIGPSLPLTKENLRLVLGNDMAPHTPIASTAQPTNSNSLKSASNLTSPKNLAQVQILLNNNNIFSDDEAAILRNPQVMELANEIVLTPRGSEMSDESAQQAKGVRSKYQYRPENTFVINFMTEIIQLDRQVKAPLPSEGDGDDSETSQTAAKWISQAWGKDHLDSNWNGPFNSASVPQLKTDPSSNSILCMLEQRVKNPKPDLAFGLFKSAFDNDDQEINAYLSNFTSLSSELYHVFFVIEAKNVEGSLVDATLQAAPSGAAMVFATRNFNDSVMKDVEEEAQIGADLRSIAFSLALTPDLATLWVHWADVGEEKVSYHMNCVNSYNFCGPRALASLKDLRHDIDNVLDWGTLTRKVKIRKVCSGTRERLEREKAERGPSQAKKRRV